MPNAKKKSVLSNSSGFSLIEVMIGVAILIVISLGMAGSLSDMHAQLRGISQKQEILELRNLLTQQLSKPGVCTWQLKDKVINVSMATSETSPSPSVINLGEIYMGQDTTSPLLVKSGERIPESQSGVRVSTVLLKNIYATGNANEYKGIFQVNFNLNSLSVPVKPLQVQQIFLTNPTDPLSAKRIDTCRASSGNIKAQCATALKPGKTAGATLGSHNFDTPPALSEVFSVHEFPGGGNAWGLACNPGFVPTTCSGSELSVDFSHGPDLWQLQYGKVGCFSDDEELAGSNPTVYLTCCQFSSVQ